MERRKLLGDILVSADLVTKDQVEKALELQKSAGIRIGQALIQMGIVSEETIIEALGKQADIPYINLDTYLIDKKVLDLIPESFARSHQVFPLFKIEDTLTIAMADPLNVNLIDKVMIKAGCEVETAVSTEKQINNAIAHYYGVSGSIDEIVKEIDVGDLTAEVKDEEKVDETPIIRIVNQIISQAVHENASDIHIEPDEKNLRVRYRVDGILHETIHAPKHLQAALISRIKVMAHMDIAETRLPQDGGIQMNLDDGTIEFRISSFPTVYGENIVIRILDQSKTVLKLEELGFPKNTLEKFRHLLNAPYGIILVTGPTGSGKTTTLYACLNAINSIEKNIITIEDPIEYRLKLIRQTQINPKAGLTFASGLRSILRQDPDIIMVGEMRDPETAEIAFQAALTGHLVLTTLHTNDAAGALARLIHLGIEPFLVASTTVSVVAQRLVRKICPNCKTQYTPSKEVLSSYNLEQKEGMKFYKGKGCKLCRHSGFMGRTGIYETMIMDERLRSLILKNVSVEKLRAESREFQGMQFLRDEGLAKAKESITTLEEVNRHTFE